MRHHDTKDSDVACDKKEKAVSALARGNGGSRREEREREREKRKERKLREKDGVEDAGGATAIARTHERKATR